MEAGHRERPPLDEGEVADDTGREPPAPREPGEDGAGYQALLPLAVSLAESFADEEPGPDPIQGGEFRELRPPRRLRIWQIVPVVVLGTLGSLMFAFPLAFEFGDGGPAVAMLGLLLCCCSAGWGITAARRVGYTWPGLPVRGSGRRPRWRVVAAYLGVVAVVGVLAVWRVARLR